MAADPTPTTVGIIQGDIRADAEQFYAEVARVRAVIRALKDDDPRVRVEADTGDALARLAEVEAAAAAVGGGDSTISVTTEHDVRGPSTVALDRAEAQAALDLARARTMAAAATEALNAADAEHDASGFIGDSLRPASMGAPASGPGMMAADWREANEAISEAERVGKNEQVVLDGLDAAAKHVAGSLGGFTKAEKDAANAGSGGGRGMGYMGLILAVVAALIPMIGPLGGYLVGLTGGFTAMGAAGVLAFLGIRKEIAAGTTVGNTYRVLLDSLSGGLDRLETTAAAVTLPGFTQAVTLLQARMPDLNTQTGIFGLMLGDTVAPAAKTVLDVIDALSPALQVGAAQVQDFVRGLDGWATGTDGAKAFGGYMVDVMPQVGEVLNHIVTTVGLLVTELAPLGSTMLGIINVAMGLVNVAEGLGPAFAPTVAAALALWGAMKGWGAIAPLLTSISAALGPVNAETAMYVDLLASEPGVLTAVTTGEIEAAAAAETLGGAIDFAAGPVGWIVGLIGALAAGLLVAANSTATATASADDYASAVERDNGVIAENVRQQAAANLQKSGAADAAKRLGISLSTLTDATLGNASAAAKIKAAEDAAYQSTLKHAGAGRATALAMEAEAQRLKTLDTSYRTEGDAVKAAIKNYNDLQGALGGTKISTEAQLRAQQALAGKYGESLPTYLAAVAAQKQQTAQAQAATAAMVQENDAAGLLKGALDLLNGKTLGLQEAQTAAAAASNGLLDSLKQNGNVIDGDSKKAVANQQAVQQVVQANQAYAEAVGKASGSSKAAVAAYEASKAALEHNLQVAGRLTPAMQRYIDKLYDIKNLKVPPTKLDADASAALAAIAAVRSGIQHLDGDHADVYINAIANGVSPGRAAQIARNLHGAAGGTAGDAMFGHLAYGGTPGGTVRGPGSALSDTAGIFHLANGEEVISNRNGQADAWRPLLKAINAGDFRGVRLGAEHAQTPTTIKTVNVGGVHLHSPVAQDPVQSAEDASQIIGAYAVIP